MHIFVTSARALGPDSWEQTTSVVSGPLFAIGEYSGTDRDGRLRGLGR